MRIVALSSARNVLTLPEIADTKKNLHDRAEVERGEHGEMPKVQKRFAAVKSREEPKKRA